ncbi:MAG TPA: ABC transporter ATP-binding protein [Polyangia bacterium]
MIRLRKLTRTFPGSGRVLDAVDLDVQAGDFVTVMGPSGAGKSTLLAVLAMLDHDWKGELWFFDDPVHHMNGKERIALGRKHVGIVFQRFHLLEDLTVAENLEVPLSYRDLPTSQRRAKVADALDRFGIVGKKDLYPAQLSGGQQQLVAIARAVIAEPSLLLADEPTGNLHTEQGAEVMKLFTQLNRAGTTIVQVTHSEQIAAYGRRIVRMRDGRVLSEGLTERL